MDQCSIRAAMRLLAAAVYFTTSEVHGLSQFTFATISVLLD